MTTYLLTYHGGGANETEEEQARAMAAWGAWMTGLGAALVDGGKPVVRSVTVAQDGSSSPGGADPVGGYSLVVADSIDDAVRMASGCPVLASGGHVEVGETIDLM